jgi:SAM-dependent methyltransferase
MKQRDVFLQGEGDAWLERNQPAPGARPLPDADELLLTLLQLPLGQGPVRVLEVGCGGGTRLAWLKQHRRYECHGVDPSAKAVQAARAAGIEAEQGTADRLPFDAAHFDVVVFGFCLYLCDREDLFRIAAEADRVLRNPGWLVIRDFFSEVPLSRPYHHRPGVRSFKMDYRSLFAWHPGYSTYFHKVGHHVSGVFTDERQEWVATSVLRKHLPAHE